MRLTSRNFIEVTAILTSNLLVANCRFDKRDRSKLDIGGGGGGGGELIFIRSWSAQSISFEIDCFDGA